MARFVFDTGMIVGYVRGAAFTQYVDKKYQPLEPPNVSVISAVSKGEILSLAIQFGWGPQKKQTLLEILAKLPAVDIRRTQILELYAEIDAYSQGKNPNRPFSGSPRNMGKNDVWIAATASVLGAKLITIDKDFDHLNGVFFDAIYIDQSLTAANA